MQTRDETKDFSPQMQNLHKFLTALSDNILAHINKLDSRLGLFSTASLVTIRRDASKTDDPLYDITIHAKLHEALLDQVLTELKVPFQYGSLGICIKEKDIEQHPPAANFYDELLKSCQLDLNVTPPTYKTYEKFPQRHTQGFFSGHQGQIKEVIVDWALQQQHRRGH